MATVASKALGRRLRVMRETAGLTGGYVAETMRYSRAKLSRQEGGTHSVSPAELSHMVVQLYGADASTPAELENLRATLADLEELRKRTEHGRAWWHEAKGDIPLQLQAFLELEAEAERIDTFSILIPGPLQTPEYTTAVMPSGGVQPEETEHAIWVRSRRRAQLEAGNPGMLDAVVTEDALRRCVAHGLAGQIEYLIESAALPNVRIRILPDAAGVHPMTGSYVVLTLPPGTLEPMMYLEWAGGSLILEDLFAVQRTLAQHVKLPAMSAEDSLRLMKELITTNRSHNGTEVA